MCAFFGFDSFSGVNGLMDLGSPLDMVAVARLSLADEHDVQCKYVALASMIYIQTNK